MRAALDYLLASSGPGGLAALGDMLELGPKSRRFHFELGRQARRAGVRALSAVGDFAVDVARGFGREARAFPKDRHELAAAWLRMWLQKGDWVLFKGSRATRMERVYEALNRMA
jgi:UDP-N-acetylmuramoyl-tripeptide--D-alanyl-D-alanine ligase